MRRSMGAWVLVGVLAGWAGLATSYLAARLLSLRLSPVTAVAELVVQLTPGRVAEGTIQAVGTGDKPLLVVMILLMLTAAFAGVGRLAARSWWQPVAGFVAIGAVGVWAVLSSNDGTEVDLLPLVVGFVTWVLALALLSDRLRVVEEVPEAERFTAAHRRSRRTFLVVVGGVVAVGALSGLGGQLAGRARQKVEQARQLLRLPTTAPSVPASTSAGVAGADPWLTPSEGFYLIDTSIVKPTITPSEWKLRIHGMVENELELTYDDLVQRDLTEAWVTLNCVSNPVGGGYIGNAWWSGVRLAPILAMARPTEGADAVLQTSVDGWTCGTPLDALTDDRNAMLAVAMNGEPLPIEHGFPVRTLVPGLYGYVSACKWVVEMEVSRFDDIEAYWTQQGWGEKGPVKIASRIDVPRPGATVRPEGADGAGGAGGGVVMAGVAWKQQTGISGVQVSLDGGAWTAAELAADPSDDAWVQWKATADLDEGEHSVRVRAIGKDGEVQTGAIAGVLPDGATGWHEVDFRVAT